jgi:hypothetical protein
MKLLVNYRFSTIGELRRWLEKRMWDFDGPEGFNDWLCRFFDEGNSITVLGEVYDYWACWGLV